MKNTLLVTALIGMSGLLFGEGNQKQQELLVHLKNIRAKLISALDQARISKATEWSQKDVRIYNFFRNVVDGFYSEAKALQKIVTEEIVRPEFNVVCDNIALSFIQIQNKFDNLPTHQRMKIMIPVEGGCRAQDPVEISETIKKELFEIFVPIFEKCHLEYGNLLEEKMTDEMAKKIFEEVLDNIIWYPELLMYNWPMINLLNEKIAELEAQA
jgi:hypothetical protein